MNVFRVRVAMGADGVAGVVASVVSLALLRACDFWIRFALPGRVVGKLYFVTMRVWGGFC